MTAAVAPRRIRHELTVVQSELLGPLTITTDSLLDFPRGLLGFPECQRFALVGVEGRQGLYWLQSLDSSALTFVLVDPFITTDGYEADISDFAVHALSAVTQDDVMLLAIVTLPDGPDAPFTANLRGPLAINPATHTGIQLVLGDSPFTTREIVDIARCR